MKELLREIGWPQAELARRVGVSPSTVGRWVGGHEPRAVVWGLEMAVAVHRLSAGGVALLALPQRRARGRHVSGGSEAWEPSATDRPAERPDADYGKRVEGWQEADMDQDGEEWGRG